MLHKLSTGDEIHRYRKSIVIRFNDKRKVVSTSVLNGGYREDITAVFNHDSNPGAGMASMLRTDSYENDLKLISTELDLNPDTTTGKTTAASMDNVSIKSAVFEDLTVTAIVTGGVEVNGGRVGDPASYYERKGQTVMIKEGTINIILNIDADLPPGILNRALVTCTEAKTAALQELMAGSNYSRGLATGSGTDGTIVIANPTSEIILTNAGKHSKLGELIGITVKTAVKEALYLQTGLCPKSQHSVLKRLKRFGINEDTIWDKYKELKCEHLDKEKFTEKLECIDVEDEFVLLASLYAHLIDQLDWDLLCVDSVRKESNFIINRMLDLYDLEYLIPEASGSKDEVIRYMINDFVQIIALRIGGE